MNFEEIIGNQILFLLSKLGVCECVRSDDLFVAIEIVEYLIVITPLIAAFALVRRIKNPEKQAIGLACVGAVFINLLLLLVLMSSQHKPSLIGQIICFAVMNLLFVGIALLPKLLKRWGEEDQIEIKDFHDTEATAKRGALECPGCGKRTLSRFAALHVAQTCGECGGKYKLVTPTFLKVLEPAAPLGSLALAYYTVTRGILRPGVAITVVALTILLVPILRAKVSKLTQVK